jgi:F-type H+-transporting ATPase subunit b
VNSVYASGGSEGGHEKSQWFEFAWKTLDFILLVGFLYWLLAEKIKIFFVGRRQEIKDSMENAAKEKTEAEKKYREYSEKIDKASHEIDVIIDMIKAQGVAEKQKIIEDAGKVAQKMKEDAQARIEQEFNKASYQLRSEAVQLSVQMAEEILKKNITAQDHEVMVREYMDKVVNKN